MTQRANAPATKVAGAHVDVGEMIIAKRRLPCICEQQHEDGMARTVGYSTCRGIVMERVKCEGCPRTWTRVNVR
ncbi:hypothetical protein E4V01_07750 [Methylorubrum sp. Q1]|uniref:hypothetical protein n=1 Tax=Methylorubrum sp. Q1 TaxID=2562453 RepID=UPI00107656AC|nr:hypothetical protein [Methylorubrum sp. Q1]TFZ59333.1 hypothetical protein E4V01_07750 [Methylorubrum sp. Q1]